MALKDNQALQLGLLSAGAAMLDPRGTGGQFGASLNKGMQAGMGTYIPMMQWQQNKKDKKEDRDWAKEQDTIRNVYNERQLKMRKEAYESEAENREQRTNIARSQFGMQQKQFAHQQEMRDLQMQYMGQFMPTAPAGPQTTNYGPRAGAIPPSQMGPRAQPQAQFQAPGMPQANIGALTGPTDFQMPSAPQGAPQGQFMDPYAQQNIGGMLDLPGMAAQGKDRAEMQQFMSKELVKHGIDMSKAGVRGDPMGLGYIIYDKQTGKAMGSVGHDMTFKPAPGSEAVDFQDYFK